MAFFSASQDALAAAAGLLFACTCYGCEQRPLPTAASVLCGPCRRSLLWHTEPLPGANGEAIAVALWLAGPLAPAVYAGKHAGQAAVWRGLARLMWQSPLVRAAVVAADGCAFVPSHPARLRARGFEHAGLLAAALAARARRPLVAALSKIRHTPAQSTLGRNQRQQNLLGAFAAQTSVVGRHLVLVDDITTTGATLRAATEALRAEGAASVQCVCLASAPA